MENEFDVRFYLGVLNRRWPLMLATFLLVAGTSIAAAVLWPPVFLSQAKIIVESQHIPASLVPSTVRAIADERLHVIKQRITTRDVLLGIVERYKLFADERKSLTSAKIVERMRDRIAIERFELGTPNKRRRKEALAIGFTVGFEDRSPEVTTQITNELVTLILDADIKMRTGRAHETTVFIQRETDRRKDELVKIEAQISAFKLKNYASLPEKLQFQLARLERAKSERNGLDREVQAVGEQLRLLELELSVRLAGGLTGNQTGLNQPTGSRELEALKGALAAKRTLYKESHPDIRTLKKQINALEAQEGAIPISTDSGEPTEQELARMQLPVRLLREKITTLEQRRELIIQQRDNVIKAVEKITILVSQTPEIQLVLGNLERQRDIIQDSLQDLTKKLGEAKLGERLETDGKAESFEVIEQPIRPTEPVRPNRPIILAGGLAAAIASAIAVTFLLEILNKTVRSGNDIARALNQPPLATIPYFTTLTELRQRRWWTIMRTIIIVTLAIAALLAVHLFYLPLDEVYFKVLRRFGV